MPIALDAVFGSGDQTASPFTWNHTCTGPNLLLIVGFGLTSQIGLSAATGVTYNGRAMTKVRSDTAAASTSFLESSLWVLHAPDLGTHQVAVTATLGTTPHGGGGSVSYTGCQQTDTVEAQGTTSGTTTGLKNIALTTALPGSWLFSAGINVAGTSPTLSAFTHGEYTQALAATISAVSASGDTSGSVPVGTNNIGMNVGAGVAEDGFVISACSFAPAPEPTLFNDYQFVKADSGLSVTEKIR